MIAYRRSTQLALVIAFAAAIASTAMTVPASANPQPSPAGAIGQLGMAHRVQSTNVLSASATPRGAAATRAPLDFYYVDPVNTTAIEWILNANSNKCLNVAGASLTDTAPVIQFTCQRTYLNDRWYTVPMGGGNFWIVNLNSGKCLNVSGASTADGAPVIQFTCQTTYTNDLWYSYYTPQDGQFWIVNVNSGKCLNVAGASTADGAPVIQFTCQTTYTNDRWLGLVETT